MPEITILESHDYDDVSAYRAVMQIKRYIAKLYQYYLYEHAKVLNYKWKRFVFISIVLTIIVSESCCRCIQSRVLVWRTCNTIWRVGAKLFRTLRTSTRTARQPLRSCQTLVLMTSSSGRWRSDPPSQVVVALLAQSYPVLWEPVLRVYCLQNSLNSLFSYSL